ncbi:MAG TPA: DUF1697 domain-containing protein [Myxococcaceae bacterium]|nr:DUF1697 domain-containing protein [Myxococcaceae bacterium]
MGQYLALLRGINVGGKNLIRMTELAACFVEHGFRSVVTYIQSGNVLFEARIASSVDLARQLEEMLAERFRYRASVVLQDRRQLGGVVRRAPDGFGARPGHERYDVLFLKPPLTARLAIQSVPMQKGVDRVSAGPGVLYFSRLIRRAAESRLPRLVSMPIYQSMTIRNWNTTTRLLELMEKSEG